MRTCLTVICALLLSGCGTAPTQAPTAQSVLAAFSAAGLQVTNPQSPPRDPSKPLPNTYKERMTFETPLATAGSGGQVFVCDTKQNCDAIRAYFDALKGLAGPYLYQSPSGLVVVQLNKSLAPEDAAKFAAVVSALP